ncbi:MAG: DUF1826 domain-containing protein [Bacteroidetes bacterium]|nr:DUF1826 domain-containing protein [Bacteroidota bacterium]
MTEQASTEHIGYVSTFEELVSRPYQGMVNAICWRRELRGDFAEIVAKVPLEGNMMVLEPEALLALDLSAEGQLAREILLNDLVLLTAHGAAPVLNLIRCYERDEAVPFFPTDVYSWHVDRAPVPTDTILCTYHGATSDILPNAQAEQKILVPEIRAELVQLYGGADDADFETWLSDNFYDLHYRAVRGAQPVSLGQGHLWRLAVDCAESGVPPCVHRAPVEADGRVRLMLIC